tara:strand:- start:307 stop:555 length:249 start_codon:yes stop_codon:yes gene_type:complete
MNIPDFIGIALVVLGTLLLIPTVYVSWLFVLGVAIFVSLGLFIVIEMGEMCRHRDDVPEELRSGDPPVELLPTINVPPREKV